MTFFQFEVLLLVFGIGQVLRESLNLWKQTLQRVIYKLRVLFLKVVSPLRFFSCHVLAVLRKNTYLAHCTTHANTVSRVTWFLTSQKYFVVHPPLNNQQTRRYEGLFEKLGLKHFYQVLDSELLSLLGTLRLLKLERKSSFRLALRLVFRRWKLRLYLRLLCLLL